MRIFIAVKLSDDMRSGLRKTMGELKKQGVEGNYTFSDNLHITLAFIGETNNLKAIKKAVNETKFEPFDISTKHLGSFRDILWMGLEGEDKLTALSDNLRENLKRNGISFDTKPFKGHITLVRRAVMPEKINKPNETYSMTVTKISVMKSERIRGKLIYTEL